jgi:hypothetical protein
VAAAAQPHDCQIAALLRDLDKLADIPAVLIHGRLDLSSQSDVPRTLTEVCDACEPAVIYDAGHTAAPPGRRLSWLPATASPTHAEDAAAHAAVPRPACCFRSACERLPITCQATGMDELRARCRH